MKKVRIEISSLASQHTSGVANYTRRLTEAIAEQAETRGSYFNFLGRQPQPVIRDTVVREECQFFPLRIYAKLDSFGFAWPFDLFKPRVDLTIHPNFATWRTCKSKRVATVVHDLTYLYYPELVEEKNLAHLRRVTPRSIKNADYIITVSEAVKQELIKEFHLDPTRCIVTTIPPAQDFFKKSTKEVHKKYGIPTKKYILFVGNLEPRKNLKTLLAAYLLLPKSLREEYSLIIGGGKGWKFEETAEKIQQVVDAGENVRRIGFVDQADLPSLMQHAALFVMPSRYEGFGMPILESFASDTPVVAADIPVLREAGGDAALYADPDSPEDFAKKIIETLSRMYNPKIGQRHLNNFSWTKNAKKITRLCD